MQGMIFSHRLENQFKANCPQDVAGFNFSMFQMLAYYYILSNLQIHFPP
jgi:hypothetical protein